MIYAAVSIQHLGMGRNSFMDAEDICGPGRIGKNHRLGVMMLPQYLWDTQLPLTKYGRSLNVLRSATFNER